MVKLVAAFALLGALAAAAFLVPIGGRTVVERWSAAPTATVFARELWAARDLTRSPPRRAAPEPHPVEHHTAEDRAALDRLLSERSR